MNRMNTTDNVIQFVIIKPLKFAQLFSTDNTTTLLMKIERLHSVEVIIKMNIL